MKWILSFLVCLLAFANTAFGQAGLSRYGLGRIAAAAVSKYDLKKNLDDCSDPRWDFEEGSSFDKDGRNYPNEGEFLTAMPTSDYQCSYVLNFWFNILGADSTGASELSEEQQDSSAWFTEFLILNWVDGVADTITCNEYGYGKWMPYCELTGCFQWPASDSRDGLVHQSNKYWEMSTNRKVDTEYTYAGVLRLPVFVPESLKVYVRQCQNLPSAVHSQLFYGHVNWVDCPDSTIFHGLRTRVCGGATAFKRYDMMTFLELENAGDGFVYMFSEGIGPAYRIVTNPPWDSSYPFTVTPKAGSINWTKILEENTVVFLGNLPYKTVLDSAFDVGDDTAYVKLGDIAWADNEGGRGNISHTREGIYISRLNADAPYGLYGLTLAQRNAGDSPNAIHPTDSSLCILSTNAYALSGGTERTDSQWKITFPGGTECIDTVRQYFPAGSPVWFLDQWSRYVTGTEDFHGGYYNHKPYTSYLVGDPSSVHSTKGIDTSFYVYSQYEIYAGDEVGSCKMTFDDEVGIYRAKSRYHVGSDTLTEISQHMVVVYTFDTFSKPTYTTHVDTFYCFADTATTTHWEGATYTDCCWNSSSKAYTNSVHEDNVLCFAFWDVSESKMKFVHFYSGYDLSSLSSIDGYNEICDTVQVFFLRSATAGGCHGNVVSPSDWTDTIAVSIWNGVTGQYPLASQHDELNQQPIGAYSSGGVPTDNQWFNISMNADSVGAYFSDTLRLGFALLNAEYRCNTCTEVGDSYWRAAIVTYECDSGDPDSTSFVRIVRRSKSN